MYRVFFRVLSLPLAVHYFELHLLRLFLLLDLHLLSLDLANRDVFLDLIRDLIFVHIEVGFVLTFVNDTVHEHVCACRSAVRKTACRHI